MEEKKNKIMTLVFIVSMLILVVSTTYAFFAAQAGGTTSSNATVTSNTTDLLTFSINRDISFTVTQAMFTENGTNQSGDATATATLTPNNKTGAATMNYYLYLNLQSNPTVYSESNTNQDPELMLQVFDGNNQLVTLTGLGTQKTIKGVTGYDITGVTGLKTLLDNHAISATNNTAAIENWRVVITLINLDVNQNDNTGKEISAEIIIRRDEVEGPSPYVYWNDDFSNTTYTSTQVPTGTGLNGTYQTREQLATAFIDWEYVPVYIKTTKVNGTVTGHAACLWYNNREFCIAPNYWNTDSATTKAKLKADMENALGITIADSSCDSSTGYVGCDAGDFYCYADTDGIVYCGSNVTSVRCNVSGSGDADCIMK